jgi:hypothetical protein
MQLYVNANKSKNDEPIKEIAGFLPHPARWKQEEQGKNLYISQKTAREVLQSLSRLPDEVGIVLDDWMSEIELIARGD